MALPQKDTDILRGLAKQLVEVAALPVQKEKSELWRKLNRLEKVRPMIWLMNSTWHETGDQIKLRCEDEFAREQELALRRTLYHWEHMKDDSVYEGKIYSPIAVECTGVGIEAHTTDPDHVFGARHYNCVIPDGADPAMIPMPTVSVDWEETERRHQRLCEIYDGILPVEKRGPSGFWFSVMDNFITWRGLDNTFTDLVDRPEWIHSWLDRMTKWHLMQLEQYEKLGVLSLNNGASRVGSGGFGITDELPQSDFDGTHVRAIDMWGHGTTQIFSLVSPAMHEEFALRYEKQFLGRFGLCNYGCCEPLDGKVDIIKKHLPNLRRLSMSPWVDVARGAEAIGTDCIFSWKPNPAIIGMESWNEELVRSTIREALDKTKGCFVEIIMKDLHTCRNEPRRMWRWVEIAMELAEQYA